MFPAGGVDAIPARLWIVMLKIATMTMAGVTKASN
jgi:hypothetical protein